LNLAVVNQPVSVSNMAKFGKRDRVRRECGRRIWKIPKLGPFSVSLYFLFDQLSLYW
jgi:hypothetical protein